MAAMSSYQLGANARKQSRLMMTLFIFSVALIAAVIAALASVRITGDSINQTEQIMVNWPLFGLVAAGVATVQRLQLLWELPILMR
jgi:hypothetical protein